MAAPVTPLPGSIKQSILSGAATKTYNVASLWEKVAAPSERQLTVLDSLARVCRSTAYPKSVVDDPSYAVQLRAQPANKESYTGSLEDAVLHNSNQFHKWQTDLEAACSSETEQQYEHMAVVLNQHRCSCEVIKAKVDETLELLDTLLNQHREVSQKSKVLYNSCEQLMQEKENLVELADALQFKLKFFDEFETVLGQFHSAQLSVDNKHFFEALKKLDGCISYILANPQYADSSTYLTKFRQLQTRALLQLKSRVQQILKHGIAQVQTAVKAQGVGDAAANGGSNTPQANRAAPGLTDGAEVSFLYVRFRAAVEPGLKDLFAEIISRSSESEYASLLQECQALYCESRKQLLLPLVQQRLNEYTSQPLQLLTRNGCEHLAKVCQLESQLLEHFLPNLGESTLDVLSGLMGPLAMVLYDSLRPRVVQLADMDQLCELVDVLKTEVLQEQLGRRGESMKALLPMLEQTLADTQQRLIYRCQAFIKEEVAAYTPTLEELDRLHTPPPPQQQPPGRADGSEASAAAAAAASAAGAGSAEGEQETSTSGSQAGWSSGEPQLYAPVRSTLLCLSKLYRAVNVKIFSGLAQEAVAACSASVQQASRLAARQHGTATGQLFMIKHLLLLREQLAPFDADFAAVEIDLDFSHLRTHLRKILAGQVSLFALSSTSSVVKMLGTSAPRVMQTHTDSRAELERQLKQVCEQFIMAATKVAAEPMMSFVTKVTAMKNSRGAAAGGGAAPIREQAFASIERLQEVVEKVNASLREDLPAVVDKMKGYLTNPATHQVLFRPIKAHILEAHGQIANLLASEYTAEEAVKVPLLPPQQLGALLDAMC